MDLLNTRIKYFKRTFRSRLSYFCSDLLSISCEQSDGDQWIEAGIVKTTKGLDLLVVAHNADDHSAHLIVSYDPRYAGLIGQLAVTENGPNFMNHGQIRLFSK